MYIHSSKKLYFAGFRGSIARRIVVVENIFLVLPEIESRLLQAINHVTLEKLQLERNHV